MKYVIGIVAAIVVIWLIMVASSEDIHTSAARNRSIDSTAGELFRAKLREMK